ncbi:hypothetical protein L6R50_19795 [Myxococcota bacterium]|nr:hypothetical protein [Myxococcota bacterium]
MPADIARKSLLTRRVPRGEVLPGRAYVIHARNGGVGVAVLEGEHLGYKLHREKFGRHFLFVEVDWEDDDSHGTAIPLRLLPDEPPTGDDALLAWLADREAEHRDEVAAAWREVLGDFPDPA